LFQVSERFLKGCLKDSQPSSTFSPIVFFAVSLSTALAFLFAAFAAFSFAAAAFLSA
jgi:hypothetical protein